MLFNDAELSINCKKRLSLVAQTIRNLPAMQETWVQSLGLDNLLEKGMGTHANVLPGKPQGQRNLMGYSSWGHKELDETE